MTFIDSKLHHKIYRWLNPGDYKLIKMRSMWVALYEFNGQRYTLAGLPRKEFKEWSRRYYQWPYFHGRIIEYGHYLWTKYIRNDHY